jgi:hypothetical protein
MKAVINVNKHSAYSGYNGQIFEVQDIRRNRTTLLINGNSVDFYGEEVIICAPLPDNLQKDYSEWVQNFHDSQFQHIEAMNFVFEHDKKRILKKLSKKYHIPLNAIMDYYK